MNKYIVKNCPSCTKQNECIAMFLRTSVDCQDRTDCKIKQVIEKCKEKIKVSNSYNDLNISYMNGVTDVCTELLQLFYIEEIE